MFLCGAGQGLLLLAFSALAPTGWGYRAPGVVGAGLAVGGLVVLAVAAAQARRRPTG